jgi:cation transport ATPase
LRLGVPQWTRGAHGLCRLPSVLAPMLLALTLTGSSAETKGAVMDIESVLLAIDRIAGGRHADHTISAEMRSDPKTRRVFVVITWLLLAELVLGTVALAVPVMLHLRGDSVALIVWMRLVVVLAMTTTLFYFAWRAQRGYYWAYSRLRLFSKIFPVVALVTAAIPGLYPLWMVTEQIFFSLILLGIAEYLSTDHMREAYAKPAKAPRPAKLANR